MKINSNIKLDTIRISVELNDLNLNRDKFRTENNDILNYKKISDIYIYYLSSNKSLVLTFSIPKVLEGTNLYHFKPSDSNNLIDKIADVLLPLVIAPKNLQISPEEYIKMQISSASISRIDINKDIETNHGAEYLRYFSKLSFSGAMEIYKYDSSICKGRKSISYSVYRKDLERKDKGDNIKLSETIRIELRAYSYYIKKWCNGLTFGAFIVNREYWSELWKKMCSHMQLDRVIPNKKSFYRILKRLIRGKRKDTQKRIIEFFRKINESGIKTLTQTEVGYIEIMTDKGYCPIHSKVKIDLSIRTESKYIIRKRKNGYEKAKLNLQDCKKNYLQLRRTAKPYLACTDI